MNTFIKLLEFMYTDAAHFFGTILVIFVIGGVLANIAKSVRIFEVNNKLVAPDIKNETKVNQNVFNDLLTLWNNRKNDKK